MLFSAPECQGFRQPRLCVGAVTTLSFSLVSPAFSQQTLTERLPFADTVVSKEGTTVSEQDTISPVGELPDRGGEANGEQDKPHELIRWAEHCGQDLGRGVAWSGINFGHFMFRVCSLGQARDRADQPVGVSYSYPVVD